MKITAPPIEIRWKMQPDDIAARINELYAGGIHQLHQNDQQRVIVAELTQQCMDVLSTMVISITPNMSFTPIDVYAHMVVTQFNPGNTSE